MSGCALRGVLYDVSIACFAALCAADCWVADARAVWAPFGSRSDGALAFEDWVKSASSPSALPVFRNSLSLNWSEYVVYSMLKAHRFSLAQALSDIVLMDESSRVVQFTGEKDAAQRNKVVSLSPRPIWGDGSRAVPMESVRPEITTAESLIEEMIDLYPDVPTDWQDINLKIVRLSQVY